MNYDYKADYETLCGQAVQGKPLPVIGITGNFGPHGSELAEGYYQSILKAGGIPFVIPPFADTKALSALLDRIDGLMLSGGADVNPLWVGEDPLPALGGINPKRDRAEFLLTRLAFNRQIPIFGICRGIQVLTIALGGTIHQDIASANTEGALIKHSQDAPRDEATHYVTAEPGSIVAAALGEKFAVNSFHHQAVATPGNLLRVTARAADGTIEAVESTEKKAVFGVQWHPECFVLSGNEAMLPLFRRFVGEAELYRQTRHLHHNPLVTILDSHCDTPMFFEQSVHFEQRDPKVLVDSHKMQEGLVDACVMVAYLPQGELSPTARMEATKKAEQILSQIKTMVAACEGTDIALTPEDAWQHKRQGLRSIFLGIENGYAFGLDLKTIEHFRNMGVVYTTLCHNGDNDICDSASKTSCTHGGLSAFGRKVVAEMNRLGMLVDLSHAGESTFYDVLETSRLPVVCSHSSSRALCNHPRNLTDDQLRALAAKGGVAQATLYAGFLSEDGIADIDTFMAHLLHMISVAGIDHIGIGTDFDGDGGVPGCCGANELPNITKRLIAEGFNEEQITKIWGGNFLRTMQRVQAAAVADKTLS